MAVSGLIQRFRDSPFLRNVATMMTGTVIAQAIPMALSPVMTRLYEPAEYGVYAGFMLAATLIAAFASWRYELAVMLPKEDGEAANVVGLCLAAAVLLAVVLVALIAVGGGWMLDYVAGTALGSWLYLLPVMVVLMSVFQTLNYWLIRVQAFRVLSLARIVRALMMGGANVGFGLLGLPGGLILSSALGQAVVSVLLVGYVLWRSDRRLGGFRVSAMRAAAVRYQRFAQYALPADLLSTLASQSPLLFLDDVAGGLYAFVQLVLGAPISVVSGSVLDAFKDRAARDYREKGNFADIFDKIARTLVLVSAGPTLLLLTLGPPIFGLVFGADWQEAGLFAQLLAVMYFLKLFVSPLSYSYFIVERQREDFVLHVLVLAGTVGGLWLGIRYFDSGRVAVALYSAVYSAAYVLYFFRSRSFSRGVARA